jgi:hypothetical protein
MTKCSHWDAVITEEYGSSVIHVRQGDVWRSTHVVGDRPVRVTVSCAACGLYSSYGDRQWPEWLVERMKEIHEDRV